MAVSFSSPIEILGQNGLDLGLSDWLSIDQSRVDQFAAVTGDHQWIHVDVERARAGPFGGPIAHGYLSLSLVNHFLPQLFDVRGFSWGVNYGCNRVRFPSPVHVGRRIRCAGLLLEASRVKNDGVQATVRMTVQIEGSDRPGCVADVLCRYYLL